MRLSWVGLLSLSRYGRIRLAKLTLLSCRVPNEGQGRMLLFLDKMVETGCCAVLRRTAGRCGAPAPAFHGNPADPSLH
jgi:hypothetical protein